MKIRFNQRTGLPELVDDPKPSEDEVFWKVKRIFYMKIRVHEISDDEIREIIKRVISGTRNIHYLVKAGEIPRLRDIANYILRELG